MKKKLQLKIDYYLIEYAMVGRRKKANSNLIDKFYKKLAFAMKINKFQLIIYFSAKQILTQYYKNNIKMHCICKLVF